MPAIPKIFYQSSMPRAGSTLLQNILAQNPEFYVTPTSGLLELVFGARLNYTNSAEFRAQEAAQMKKAFLAFRVPLSCFSCMVWFQLTKIRRQGKTSFRSKEA